VNYFGNNPKAIYDALEKRKETTNKSEFETTEEYQRRIVKINNKPIIGKLSTNGLITLKVEYVSVDYSADESEFSIKIKTDRQRHYSKLNEYVNHVTVYSDSKSGGIYSATNGYGARINVNKVIYSYYEAAINNYSELPDILLDNVFKMKSTPDIAINIKDNISVILIGVITDPYTGYLSGRIGPELNSPFDQLLNHNSIYINVIEYWIYNKSTGEIYSKIKKRVAT
jgi:hypothetical protein